MKVKSALLVAIVLGIAGCNGGDDVAESDSMYVEANNYKAQQFTLDKKQQVKVRASLIGGHSVELFLLDESDYQTWVDTTQNRDFANAGLTYIAAITPLNGSSQETGWRTLEAGKYRVMVENTVFSTVKPSSSSTTSTASYSVLTKPTEAN